MKGKILVVDCLSTGFNYVEDIIKRGCEPVNLIGTEEATAVYRQIRDATQKKLPPEIKIIRDNPDYDDILRQVREIEPLHIITGRNLL